MSLKLKKLKSIFPANGGCGCDPKATDIIQPKPRPTATFFSDHCRSSSDSSLLRQGCAGGENEKCSIFDDEEAEDSISTTSSPHQSDDHKLLKPARRRPPSRKILDSFAVVKDSDDPYHDFRQSMLQMIFEKEIYSRQDLEELLDCFLRLNSPHYHEVIVRAFVDIWSGGSAGG